MRQSNGCSTLATRSGASPGPALAGAGPNATHRGGAPLDQWYCDVIVLSQPCYDLFDLNVSAKLLYEYQNRRQIIGVNTYVSAVPFLEGRGS